MFSSYRDLIVEVRKFPKMRVCVAAAADEMVLLAVKDAINAGFIETTLVGNTQYIWKIAKIISLDLKDITIINENNPALAARLAVQLAAQGEADVLMKGMVNSSDFLREVIRSENNLVAGKILSHMAIFEIPGFNRLLFVTDGGLNVSPDLEQKKKIIINAVELLSTIGIARPKVAVLAAEPMVDGSQPLSAEAEKLKAMADEGEIEGATLDGPIDLGTAVDLSEALNQGSHSPLDGKADVLIVPNIEVGNALGKSIIHFAGGTMAGLITGAKKPVVLTSRAERPQGKLASIALACYYSMKKKRSGALQAKV